MVAHNKQTKETISQMEANESQTKTKVRTCVRMLDVNQDGQFDKEEQEQIKKCPAFLDFGVTEDCLALALDQADTNGDGILDTREVTDSIYNRIIQSRTPKE